MTRILAEGTTKNYRNK